MTQNNAYRVVKIVKTGIQVVVPKLNPTGMSRKKVNLAITKKPLSAPQHKKPK